MTPYGGGYYRAVEVKVDGVPFRPGGADYVWLVSGKYFICFIALTYNRAWHAAPIPSQGEGRGRRKRRVRLRRAEAPCSHTCKSVDKIHQQGVQRGRLQRWPQWRGRWNIGTCHHPPERVFVFFGRFGRFLGFFLVLWVCVRVCFFVYIKPSM